LTIFDAAAVQSEATYEDPDREPQGIVERDQRWQDGLRNGRMNRRWMVVTLIFFGIVISYIDRGKPEHCGAFDHARFRHRARHDGDAALGVFLDVWRVSDSGGRFLRPVRNPARLMRRGFWCGRSRRRRLR
jgi:hypothetical protein